MCTKLRPHGNLSARQIWLPKNNCNITVFPLSCKIFLIEDNYILISFYWRKNCLNKFITKKWILYSKKNGIISMVCDLENVRWCNRSFAYEAWWWAFWKEKFSRKFNFDLKYLFPGLLFRGKEKQIKFRVVKCATQILILQSNHYETKMFFVISLKNYSRHSAVFLIIFFMTSKVYLGLVSEDEMVFFIPC